MATTAHYGHRNLSKPGYKTTEGGEGAHGVAPPPPFVSFLSAIIFLITYQNNAWSFVLVSENRPLASQIHTVFNAKG